MKHPSEFISIIDADIIRNYAEAAEKAGTLHEEQLKIIYRNKWFNLFVPKEYGGLELTLIEALQVEEGLAYIDGSTGWTVTLCSGANWFIGFLDKAAASEIFNNEKVCLAGSGKPSGIAKIIANGYEVSGYWKYATGAPHAAVFTANCVLEKDGKTLMDKNGNPQIASFWFKKEEVSIDYDWSSTGMIATASESFAIKNLIVPINRLFHINSADAVLPHPVYRYPFLQFAEATLAVNISGMAMRFLDLCEPLFAKNEKDKYRDEVSFAALNERLLQNKNHLQQLRTELYHSVENSWYDLLQNNSINENNLQQVSKSCRRLASNARLLVEEIYPYCGLVAANPATEINRVWRNLHAASQHSLLNFPVVFS